MLGYLADSITISLSPAFHDAMDQRAAAYLTKHSALKTLNSLITAGAANADLRLQQPRMMIN
jgi:hypothetical protein